MVFSSTVFLFLFLPLTLGVYFIAPKKLRNFILLFASLFFYAWGEAFYVFIMLFSILANYIFGIWVDRVREERYVKLVIAFSVFVNIALISMFKYANFIVDNINALIGVVNIPPIDLAPVHLPLGISFFTFQAISYVIDVYRKDAEAHKDPIKIALYISCFPQLIAGPIVRYRDVAREIVNRVITLDLFSYGVKRFVIGLGKKLIIANTLAVPADKIFAIPAEDITSPVACIGIICYALQLYFDFSGYSDMAIGLGRMLGFHFLENFNYPYISQSIREFWTRWHISLSTWFRDYIFIPMGGSKKGPVRVYFNLFTIFFLCGLWHGASWNFVVFGMMHGFLMIGERLGFEEWIKKFFKPFAHLYFLVTFLLSLVIFRCETIPHAFGFYKAIFGFSGSAGVKYHISMFFNVEVTLAFIFAVIASLPVMPTLKSWKDKLLSSINEKTTPKFNGAYSLLEVVTLIFILFLSTLQLSAGTYNPFIYFRF